MNRLAIILVPLILTILSFVAWAATEPFDPNRDRGPVRHGLDMASPYTMNRVHNAGKMAMNITNYGYMGNDAPASGMKDPCPPRYYSVTAFDFGDPHSGLGPLATRPTANAVLLAPAGSAQEPVRVVPNPYRAYEDYTHANLGMSWENMNDGTTTYYPQQDRRLEFINLPAQCLIRVFTVAGDVVQIIPHNLTGDVSQWPSLNSERWDLNSRNKQQVVSGIYLFSVEDMTPGNGHKIATGKFVIIR